MPPFRTTPLLGILLMVLATIFLPIKDALAKLLGGSYSPLWLLWAQYLFMYIVLAPVIVRQHGPGVLRPQRLGLQALRGRLLAACRIPGVLADRANLDCHLIQS